MMLIPRSPNGSHDVVCVALLQSPSGRWSILAERPTPTGYVVSLRLREPSWPSHEVVRSYRFRHRARALAFVQRLRGLLTGVVEGVELCTLASRLPGVAAA